MNIGCCFQSHFKVIYAMVKYGEALSFRIMTCSFGLLSLLFDRVGFGRHVWSNYVLLGFEQASFSSLNSRSDWIVLNC